MQISLNIPDNLPIDMVKNYIHSIGMQMQLLSQTIVENSLSYYDTVDFKDFAIDF